ncbi:MAG TPA: ADP-ribosylglycohydrolase family protein [Ktedonobacteraceae bacterium]|nr:ADP-ribosylglycohydrolase family protein [Ktedonobacteraceae bacterium]
MTGFPPAQRASGCLFGLAFGDALGADTEFLSVSEILRSFPPAGPTHIAGNPARVTDDTQMTLAFGKALLEADRPYTAARLEEPLTRAFVEWSVSSENNRAPGLTCMRACEGLGRGQSWLQSTVIGSKGCGANMRVAPAGLLPSGKDGVTEEVRAALAQFQAAITHGHPTALTSADLTARAIADLSSRGDSAGLLHRLRDYVFSQRTIYHVQWLGSLWQQATIYATAEEYIARGWDEVLHMLDRLETALRLEDRNSDPCLQTGEGWTADEALATGLLCFLLYPDDPVAAIRRAVVSSGDSDSIACLTGAFAGVYHGLAAWPAEWITIIEYRDLLSQLGNTWDKTF